MVIYKCTNNLNNKFYIGMTKGPLELRIKSHLKCLKTRRSYFHFSLNKHGPKNFTWEVIDSSAQSYEQLKLLEIKYIAELKPKYNMTKGGDGVVGAIRSEETRRKHALSMKGKNSGPRPEWVKKKLSIARKGKKFSPISEEHRQKLISSWNKRKADKESFKKQMQNNSLKQKEAWEKRRQRKLLNSSSSEI